MPGSRQACLTLPNSYARRITCRRTRYIMSSRVAVPYPLSGFLTKRSTPWALSLLARARAKLSTRAVATTTLEPIFMRLALVRLGENPFHHGLGAFGTWGEGSRGP